jgi:hypothetical protein
MPMGSNDRPQAAYRTTNPAVLAAWMSTAEKIRDISNRSVDEAKAIGKNKGLMVQRSFGDERFVGLAPLNPKDPPAGWRYVREQLEPRRGKPGEEATAWLAGIQVPSMRDAMKAHGLPRHCSLKYGFFGVPGMFQHDGVIWVIYSGEPEGEPGPAWEKVRPSEYLAAQERMQESEAAEAVSTRP